MVKSQKPSDFPKDVQDLLLSAMKDAMMVPLHNAAKAKSLRTVLHRLADAHRTHRTRYAEAVGYLSTKMYSTMDVTMSNPKWQPGDQYLYTLIVDCRPMFAASLAKAAPMSDASPPQTRTLPIEDPAPGDLGDDIDDENRMSEILGGFHKL